MLHRPVLKMKRRPVIAPSSRVRPRLSTYLRVVLNNDPPFDADKAVLDRTRQYPALRQSSGRKVLEMATTVWDGVMQATIRDGRLGGALRGPVKDSFNRFVRLSGQLGGEEGAVDSATGLLFEMLTSGDPAGAKAEFESLVQRSVDEKLWTEALGHAQAISEWYKGHQAKAAEKKAGPNGGSDGSGARGEWGGHLALRHTLDPDVLSLADLDDGSSEEEEDDAACDPRLDMRDDHVDSRPLPPPPTSAPATPPNGWGLMLRCEQHVAVGGSLLPPATLGTSILDVLRRSSRHDVELQTRLFELLGEQGFELMQWVLDNRHALGSVKDKDVKPRLAPPSVPSEPPPPRQPRGPVVAASVTIQTEEERRMEKERRKEDRRARKRAATAGEGKYGPTSASDSMAEGFGEVGMGGMVPEPDWLAILGFDPRYLEEERGLGLQKGMAPGGRWEGTQPLLPKGSHSLFEPKRGLPANATKLYKPGYEEVNIPPPDRSKSLPPMEMVDVATALEPWAQLAFKNFKKLNRIQSTVFDSAYNSQENLLICAPTGAGKTNIAMLSFLALVKEHVKGGGGAHPITGGSAKGLIDKTGLKAIYVAPMKALAQEVVSTFTERLRDLGLVVKEMTGDMQLSKKEIEESQLIVTTPEKWDVVTRKGGEGSLATIVGLIIIDEVHLLADERGAVIESIVARTQRQVESTQRPVRLVGLSATLPNYKDVALFLRASPKRGLFHFGPEYRPVPLDMTFIGVTEKQKMRQLNLMNDLAYAKALDSIRRGYQAMVFVHSRKDTTRTAQAIRDKAMKMGTIGDFATTSLDAHKRYATQAAKSRNADLREHFPYGFGIHHAGMLRPDRSLTENMFSDGVLKVLVCTATLAWGINLPAHTVVIKGTEVYNPDKGGFTDLSMLDVMQIFGRAGRPQYGTSGEAILITTQKSLPRYLALLTDQMPIESSFIKQLPDHLNAEVVSGTVTSVKEGVAWLSYTYLYIRMLKNPMVYGMKYEELVEDPMLEQKRLRLIHDAAKILDQNRMVRYDPRSGNLAVTDMGRTSSHYYIRHESVTEFNHLLSEHMSDADALHVICAAKEFEEVRVRPEELDEIDKLKAKSCPFDVVGAVEDSVGKTNVLLQAYISHAKLSGFTVISDTNYVASNAGRVSRALFEVCLRKGWCSVAATFLRLCKTIDRRVWWTQTPLRQFEGMLPADVIRNLEEKHASTQDILDIGEAKGVGQLCHNIRAGGIALDLTRKLPRLDLSASIQPITRGILRVTLQLRCAFRWHDQWHGSVEPWWIWVEDATSERVYHSEPWLLHKKQKDEAHVLAFTIPIFEPLPPQYYVRAVSDRWVGCESVIAVSFKHLILPDKHPPHTDLLDLAPLPKAALNNPTFEALYKFNFFNPIQTQLFHAVYHSDENILVGAPTGSGKTLIAELALLRLLHTQPGAKTVYIAPLKALARERLSEWREKLGKALGLVILELSGDVTPDISALKRADILVATPEKWDGITRSWKKRDYVGAVRLLIMDEIHLLGEDRGPVLEVIVSRMRYIAAHTDRPVRMLGLSTALANPKDLADWLGVPKVGLFNFRPSVRPIPMEVHVQGFPGRHYCPRMATMNKPTYQAIMEHSAHKPALVFVSSRRQTRLTALELISLCAQSDHPKHFLHMDEEDAASLAETCRDAALRHTLVFGIGIHHAGLNDHDRSIVEELFVSGKIHVLVCTSTLAWGVNFPAHLVVIKGTEYFDGKSGRYVDFPITDILQMMGRAGRPQFDNQGVAVILVHEPKKNFVRKFLYEPFPVESSLRDVLHNHLNAEVAGGAISSKQDAVEYLTWTFFFRRLVMNPTYYHLDEATADGVQRYLLDLVDATLEDLRVSGCVEVEDDFLIRPTILGFIASYYYLDHRSVALFQAGFRENGANMNVEGAAALLAEAHEYEELPVRHNEDLLNAQLAASLTWTAEGWDMGSSHTKAFLLLQAHFEGAPLPITDYINDTKSVLDQAARILNAMVDIAADEGMLTAALATMGLSQMVTQGCSERTCPLLQLSCVADEAQARAFRTWDITTLRALAELDPPRLRRVCEDVGVPLARLGDEVNRMGLVRVLGLRVVEEEGGKAVGREGGGSGKRDGPFVLEADRDYVLQVTLGPLGVSRGQDRGEGREGGRGGGGGGRGGRGGGGRGGGGGRKGAKEGGAWWMVLGVEGDDELLALKRVMGAGRGGGGNSTVNLVFPSPESLGPSAMALYVVSDAYRGVDMRVDIELVVVGGGEEEGEGQGEV